MAQAIRPREIKSAFDVVASRVDGIQARFGYRGIGVGKLFTVDHRLPDYKSKLFENAGLVAEAVQDKNIAAEIETLSQALAHFNDYLDEREGIAKKAEAEDALKVIGFHRTMAGLIKDSAERLIKEEHKTAAKAIEEAAKDIMEQLANVPMAKNQVKVDDIKVISQRMIRETLGIPQPNITKIPKNSIVLIDNLPAYEVVDLQAIEPDGLIILEGSPSGHVGDFCRARHIPCAFLNDPKLFERLKARQGYEVAVDGLNCQIVDHLDDKLISAYDELEARMKMRNEELTEFADKPTLTKDGTEIKLSGTIAEGHDINDLKNLGITDISLVRTELLFTASDSLADIDTQVRKYLAVLMDADETNTVTFRSFDFVGDKDHSRRVTMDDLKTQFEAIFIAAAQHGRTPIKVEIPNVKLSKQLGEIKKLYVDTYKRLKEEGKPVPDVIPQFGMMIETPSAGANLKCFEDLADFGAFGSNDWKASWTVSKRNEPDDEVFLDICHPEILHPFIDAVADANELGLPITLCGEQGMNEYMMAVFIGMGIRDFSTSPASALEMRYTASRIDIGKAEALVREIRETYDITEIRDIIRAFNEENHIGLLNIVSAESQGHAPECGAGADGQDYVQS